MRLYATLMIFLGITLTHSACKTTTESPLDSVASDPGTGDLATADESPPADPGAPDSTDRDVPVAEGVDIVTDTGDEVPPPKCTQSECNDKNPCTDDFCDPESGCRHDNNVIPCDDGNPCSLEDSCAQGACKPGRAMDCSDGNLCTTDFCDSAGACRSQNNTQPCSDSKDCTMDDTCAAGVCAGTPRNCDDGNPCTVDTCSEQSGCTNASAVENSQCDDGNACTSNDRCQAGLCKGDGKSCDDGNPCTDDTCDPGTQVCKNLNRVGACDDGDNCTLGDTCSNGACKPGTALNCDDGNACSKDSCDAATGTCRHQYKNCNDSNECTLDTCDSATGACGHTARVCPGAPCNPGVCAPATGECTNSPKNCADKNACTTDYCNAKTGECLHDAYSGTCDDGNACTFRDTCATKVCKGQACDDGNPCTKETCDPFAIRPVCKSENLPALTSCDDGNPCTVGGHCGAVKLGWACLSTKKDCDDKNACTYDSCDPVKGACVNTAIAKCVTCTTDRDCTNGFCSGGICFTKKPKGETCTTGTQCQTGTCLDDGSGTLVCMDSGKGVDEVCLYNAECKSGICNPDFRCGCTAHVQCSSADYCLVSECVPKLVRGMPCLEVAQCVSGLICASSPLGLFCQLDASQELTEPCLTYKECVSGRCLDFICACNEDADCGTKKWCRLSFCIPCCYQRTECKPCLVPCCNWQGLECDATCGCSCGEVSVGFCESGCPGA